jgi:glycosyltransferase involved in cell wall biosynthesis
MQSLVQQSLDPSSYEILVVDNGSTDSTPERIEVFRTRYPEHCIVKVDEPEQGLGYARNTGFRRAKGTFVAYLDDDARASSTWLATALELFETVEPVPVCVGGPIVPCYSTEKPPWFRGGGRTWGDFPLFLPPGESFSGSNMLWRKEVLEAFGGFPVSVGVRGDYLSVGEETMLFKKIWQQPDRAKFYYSPELLVYHWVDPAKMSVFYQLKRSFAGGHVSSQFFNPQTLADRMRFVGGSLVDMAKMGYRLLADRKAHTYRQGWLIEDGGPIVAKLGAISGAMGFSLRLRQR